MSYSRLVADAHHSQTRGEELLDQIIFFVVESRSAQVVDVFGLHQRFAVLCFLKRPFAAVPQPLRHHVHGGLEIDFLPSPCIRTAIFHLGQPAGMGVKLVSVRALGTEMSARNGRLRIAFDGNKFPALVIYELSAAHATIRTDGTSNFSAVMFGTQIPCVFAHHLSASAVGPSPELADERPAREQIIEHSKPPYVSLHEQTHKTL